MNLIKKHLALIIPLVALLFALEAMLLTNRIITDYERRLVSSYSIIVASSTALNFDSIKRDIAEAKSLEIISADAILDELKSDLSKEHLDTLKRDLPRFYTLKLSAYPSAKRLETIATTLLKTNGVLNVESFAKAHGQTYRVLLILKASITLFACLIVLISFLLMIKHIEVWRYEHLSRMEIMGYLGASSVMKNRPLFRLAIVDSIISGVLVFLAVLYLANSEPFGKMLSAISVEAASLVEIADFGMLFGASVLIGIFSVFMVIIKQKGE